MNPGRRRRRISRRFPVTSLLSTQPEAVQGRQISAWKGNTAAAAAAVAAARFVSASMIGLVGLIGGAALEIRRVARRGRNDGSAEQAAELRKAVEVGLKGISYGVARAATRPQPDLESPGARRRARLSRVGLG